MYCLRWLFIHSVVVSEQSVPIEVMRSFSWTSLTVLLVAFFSFYEVRLHFCDNVLAKSG